MYNGACSYGWLDERKLVGLPSFVGLGDHQSIVSLLEKVIGAGRGAWADVGRSWVGYSVWGSGF